jgi:CYTH domain-containing protein
MGLEIERKFLVDLENFVPEGSPIKIKQGYLISDSQKVVRIRTKGEKAFVTIKSNVNGVVRKEYEYAIPYSDALEMFELCQGYPIFKTRWEYEYKGHVWEIDVFEGANSGLVVAEIELSDENESFEKPRWAGIEVSTDERYFNSNLSKNPFSEWQ